MTKSEHCSHERKQVTALRSGNDVGRINEVTLRRARLVPGWVTVFGRANHLGMQPATQANSASYPTPDGKRVPAGKSAVMLCG